MGILERREREKEQRRKAIIDAAETLFFSKGIESATMEDVAEQAELSKGTLYLYFKSKQELYFAVTKRGLDIMTDMFEKAVSREKFGLDKIHAVGLAYYQFSRLYPDYHQAMIHFDAQDPCLDESDINAQACFHQADRSLKICREAIQAGIDDGSIRPDIDPEKTAIILWGQTMGVIQLIALKGAHFRDRHDTFKFRDLDEIVEGSFSLIRSALMPRFPKET